MRHLRVPGAGHGEPAALEAARCPQAAPRKQQQAHLKPNLVCDGPDHVRQMSSLTGAERKAPFFVVKFYLEFSFLSVLENTPELK